MIRQILLLITLTISLFSASGAVLAQGGATVTIENQKISYQMPYPGLLPDSPLYFLKAFRDRVVEFATRDNLKKAQLYLLYSDKRAQMSVELSQKGKTKLASSTFSKGEKYFEQIPNLLRTSKSQGAAPSQDFIQKLRLSNAKHRELIEMLLTQLPQGELAEMQQVLDINKKIGEDLKKF